MTFQETKREQFDLAYIRNFYPKRFNQYSFMPSAGNSGGLITIWNGNLFKGREISKDYFQITVELTSKLDNTVYFITNVYGPNSVEGKTEFSNWLLNVNIQPMQLWLIVGDFNYIRGPENRNRGGGDHNDMMHFNNIIINLDLVEIPLKGRQFTWSNMQDTPLLEKLDWIFTSADWTSKFPNTLATPMAKLSSNHVPINIQIDSMIPKCHIFRFEEFWLDFEGFIDNVSNY